MILDKMAQIKVIIGTWRRQRGHKFELTLGIILVFDSIFDLIFDS